MAGYKHPCRYCDRLVPPNSNACPYCGKKNPLGPLRCPKCRSPIQNSWVSCSRCGLSLEIICLECGKTTFFADYCQHCDAPLVVTCPNPKCKKEQPPVGEKCEKCGRNLRV